MNQKSLTLAVALLCLGLAGCRSGTKTKEAVEQANLVAEDSRRVQRIPLGSEPSVAEAAMGRKPDAVQYDHDREIHYYVVRGAVNGETLRLIYRQGKLIDQGLEYVPQFRQE